MIWSQETCLIDDHRYYLRAIGRGFTGSWRSVFSDADFRRSVEPFFVQRLFFICSEGDSKTEVGEGLGH